MNFCVIFDWDGTLADTRIFLLTVYQQLFNELGCKINDNFIERRVGMGGKELIKDVLKTANLHFEPKELESIFSRKLELQMELTDLVTLFKGSVDLLDSLYNIVDIGLATMAPRLVVEKLLKQNSLEKYFDTIITVDEVTKPKPDPEIFLRCAENMGKPPEYCIVIEDSIFGVIAAKKAKMKCLAISQGVYSTSELKNENADLVINSVEEREEILSFLYIVEKEVHESII